MKSTWSLNHPHLRNRERYLYCFIELYLTFFTCISAGPLFDADFIEQLRLNIYYYAELLFRWQLYYKRLELLKVGNRQDILTTSDKAGPHRIGMSPDFMDSLNEYI